MVEWSMGAGQYSLDRKGDDLPNRFYKSKGIDVFTYPQRATLLPATVQRVSNDADDILMSRCGPYLVVASSGTVVAYNSSWSVIQTYGVGDTYGGSAWSTIYSICSNDTYCYIATDTGLWFALIGTDTDFQLYSAPDASPYGGGFTMVRWANDQLIASKGPRLYAFQPRTATANGANAPFGSAPSTVSAGTTGGTITAIDNSGTTATVFCVNHGLAAGQPLVISGSATFAGVDSISLTSGTMTIDATDHGFSVGQKVEVVLYFNGAPSGRKETVTVLSVADQSHFTYAAHKVGAAIIGTGFTGGTVTATGSSTGYGYNQSWNVASVTNANEFTITVSDSGPCYGANATGGTVAPPTSQNGTYAPDVLVTHENPNWVWSDATGGQTQVYFGGYVLNGDVAHSGAILRSDLLGSSTSSTDGLQTIASSSVAQPWMLDTPVQCLPMSPDEYPTCVQAYLNYIFVGTNRGIRMCQTLSIYDPTATATGDLKSGAIIPNLLQPVTLPVTALIGDGRFVWFAWNNYDDDSTGLGKLDISTFLPEDPLAPVYASDLMVTGQGVINSLDWDPNNNVPLMAISGLGIWGANATNEGGNVVPTTYVESGTIESSYFDFGIAENKIPVFFDYGVYLPVVDDDTVGEMAATLVMDPLSPSPVTLTPTAFTSNAQDIEQTILQTGGSQDRGRQFQTTITLSTSNDTVSPVMFRWTAKAWPTPVQGTLISAVINVTTVVTVDGVKQTIDPEAEYNWLEDIRWNSIMVQFSDGLETSVIGVINTIDDIPHKARGRSPGGHEGDFVIDVQTLTPFSFTPWSTA
jgi:hypothetical protein